MATGNESETELKISVINRILTCIQAGRDGHPAKTADDIIAMVRGHDAEQVMAMGMRAAVDEPELPFHLDEKNTSEYVRILATEKRK